MDSAKISALRTVRLIHAMEQFALAYKRATDDATRAEAYGLWHEALRDLADAGVAHRMDSNRGVPASVAVQPGPGEQPCACAASAA